MSGYVAPSEQPAPAGWSPAAKGGAALGCLVVLVGVVYFGLVHVMTGMAIKDFLNIDDKWVEEYCGEQHLTMKNMTDNLWWPGCDLVVDGDFSKCKGGCIKQQTMDDIDAFNEKYGGKLVSYKSRPGKGEKDKDLDVVTLTGWWLPAPNHKADTPRIVVQHGFTSNSNKHRTMFFAYQLRKIGFSVLVNNLRDHCYSEDSKERVVQWGHAYPYDLLGAWDYAVKDPDNNMGGSIGDDKVGIVGFSMGAFITTTVFGLEGRVPAVWVDAPPFSPLGGFKVGASAAMAGMGIGFLADVIIPPVWANLEAAAKEHGVDINENTPESALPKGPDTKRPIQWVGNKGDVTVAFADGAKLAAVLKKNDKKYKASKWDLEGSCNGETHCEDHIRIPDEYEAKLCSFWTEVFGLKESSCGLEEADSDTEAAAKSAKSDSDSDDATSRRLQQLVV